MTTNYGVAVAWRDRRRASSRSMMTDGNCIYSYGLLVGIRTQDGVYVRNAVSDRNGRNPGGCFYSMTTSSKHMPGVFSAGHELRATVLCDAEFKARFGR